MTVLFEPKFLISDTVYGSNTIEKFQESFESYPKEN